MPKPREWTAVPVLWLMSRRLVQSESVCWVPTMSSVLSKMNQETEIWELKVLAYAKSFLSHLKGSRCRFYELFHADGCNQLWPAELSPEVLYSQRWPKKPKFENSKFFHMQSRSLAIKKDCGAGSMSYLTQMDVIRFHRLNSHHQFCTLKVDPINQNLRI